VCSVGRDVEIGWCDDSPIPEDDINDPDQSFQFVGDINGDVQIQLVGTDLCWEMVQDPNDLYSSRVVTLQYCDDSKESQKFHAANGAFDHYRFEIETSEGDCISTNHYPKKNEDLYETSCSNARGDSSSYWMKY